MSLIAKQVYDPRELSWDYWCALMAELFSSNQIGTAPEDRWQEWANSICGIGRLAGVPDSRGFERWQDWASALNNSLRR